MTVMNRMMALVFVLAIGFGVATERASAQEPSAEHLALGAQLSEILNTNEAFDTVVRALRSDVVRLAVSGNPDKAEAINAAGDEVAAEIRSEGASLRAEVARIYATSYTEEELSELIAFYSSGVGAKFLTQRQVVDRSILEATIVWGDLMSERIVTLMREKLAAEGIEF
ncbi:MAG: DUF2059 domain-containing protein [Hyphomicrobiaceae bacterium]|nr:DUF2059 domain-containing protein [Hyphomicrobiaceae bacterium]